MLGRFLSPDPIVPEPGNPQALNRYAYVYNNPFIYIDPSGLVTIRNSAGEVWDGEWVDGRFQGHRKLFGSGDLTRLGSSRWLACRNGDCTPYKQHYYEGYWVLRKRPLLEVLAQAVVAAVTGGAELAANGEEPGSSFCFGNQPIPLLNGTLGMIPQPGFAWPGGSPGNRVKPKRPTMVYRSIGPDGRVNYVGMTYVDQFKVRSRAHKRQKGIDIEPIPGLNNLTRQEAHAAEEALIVRYRMRKEGGTLLNQRHSISPRRGDYEPLLQLGRAILRSVGYADP